MAMDVRAQACAYARNGQIRVVKAGRGDPPAMVRARVAGQRCTYFVRLNDGVWVCSCSEDGCPHVAAVALVTGHDSLARKPVGASR